MVNGELKIQLKVKILKEIIGVGVKRSCGRHLLYSQKKKMYYRKLELISTHVKRENKWGFLTFEKMEGMVDCWRDALAWQTGMQRLGRWQEPRQKKKKKVYYDL